MRALQLRFLLSSFIVACSPEQDRAAGGGGNPPPGDSGVPGTDTGSGPDDTGPCLDDTAGHQAPDYGALGAWRAGITTAATQNQGGDDLTIEVWFPSLDQGGEPHVYGWDSWNHTGASFDDVQPDCSEPRPVMVHSHGNTSIRWEMFWLAEFAATHGWVVVAPDHPGNTFLDSSAGFEALVVQRPADVQDAFDWLLSEAEGTDSSLNGCVDPDAGYVVSGYSFGGYTAYATGGAELIGGFEYGDPRVMAAVTYAPWDANAIDGGTAAIERPVLTLGAMRDGTVGTDFQALHAPITSVPRALGSFANAGHYSFVPIYCAAAGDGCGDAYVESELFTSLVRTAVLAFVEHLRGQQGAIEQLPEHESELNWDLVLE